MTDEEKLKQFYEVTIEDAKRQNLKEVGEFEDALRQSFADHREDAERKAELEVKLQKEVLLKQKNSETARRQTELRRMLGQKQDELKQELFESIEERLIKFKSTDEYLVYLKKCIDKSMAFAKGMDMTVYIDTSDEKLVSQLGYGNEVNFKVSEDKLIGGIRAAIPEKNVLIDETFSSKLKEEHRRFKF